MAVAPLFGSHSHEEHKGGQTKNGDLDENLEDSLSDVTSENENDSDTVELQ